MELLALVLVNIFLAIIMYYIISMKVTNIVKDYQNQKLKKEIQTLALDFYKESENYLALMDSRITSLKNLLQKADSMGINFEKLDHSPKNEQVKKNTPETKIYTESTTNSVKKEIKEDPFIENLVSGLGKSFKSLFGIPLDDAKNESNYAKTKPQQSLNVTIGGNPLFDKDFIEDKNDQTSFKSVLNQSKKSELKETIFDKIQINASTVLKELPQSATKVEKVVYLLKKGFTHLEISEATGLAIPEISLIETIKIDRSRKL